MSDFTIGQNDTGPEITSVLKDDTGAVADLTGATVKFHMVSSSNQVVVNAAASIVGAATAGEVQYTWLAADTANVGTYQFEWEVTFSDGVIITFPNGSVKPTVQVTSQLA